MITGFRCASCGAEVGIDTPMPWRCPRVHPDEGGRHHVLIVVDDGAPARAVADPDPFVAFGDRLAWRAFARSHGMSSQRCDELTREVGAAIAHVAGTRFTFTPFLRQDRLSDELGFTSDGGVWVKDETSSVGGSHKARHLMSILLHLLAVEELGLAQWPTRAKRPPLAIASCGNAAIAASTLAAAVDWPIVVFVPPWAGQTVTAHLTRLGATLTVCPRQDGDPPGDPTMHRFRDAVAQGAVPFSVQGPENALCLDGGRTLGWEIVERAADAGLSVPSARGRSLDRMFVQVGGGAFASGIVASFAGSPLADTAIMAVQTEGCAPLARAWDAVQRLPGGAADAAAHWGHCMWPWESEPHSLADGILDDETYDWLGIVEGMARTGGAPVVAAEHVVVEAARLAPVSTGIDVSPTGAAGLAGLLAVRDTVGDDERVAVVFSGLRRD